MNQKELFYLAGQCLALEEHIEFRETILFDFLSKKENLENFIFLCSNHLVLPVIYVKFKKYNLLEVFPSEFNQHLEEIYVLNKKRNFKIIQQIDEISARLAKENIIPVYMKGTANLLDGVYSDYGERMMGDIDFLIPEKDYLKTAELIIKMGYKTQRANYYDVSTLKHYPRLFRADVPADVEIHRVPVNIKYSRQFTNEIIFRNKKIISEKENCFVPADKHKVIHSFIHSQLSNSGHRFKQTSLRDLYDLYLFSKRLNPASLISEIEEKDKAISYFVLGGRILNLKNRFYHTENKNAKRFCFFYDLSLTLKKTHRLYILMYKFFQLIFVYYLGRLIKAVYQKSSREYIFNRLKDRNWYSRHFRGLRKFFS